MAIAFCIYMYIFSVCVCMLLVALVSFLCVPSFIRFKTALVWYLYSMWCAQCTCEETFHAIHPHYFILLILILILCFCPTRNLFISHSVIHSTFQNPCLIFIHLHNAFALFMLIRFWCSFCSHFNRLSKSKWERMWLILFPAFFAFYFACVHLLIWKCRSK